MFGITMLLAMKAVWISNLSSEKVGDIGHEDHIRGIASKYCKLHFKHCQTLLTSLVSGAARSSQGPGPAPPVWILSTQHFSAPGLWIKEKMKATTHLLGHSDRGENYFWNGPSYWNVYGPRKNHHLLPRPHHAHCYCGAKSPVWVVRRSTSRSSSRSTSRRLQEEH